MFESILSVYKPKFARVIVYMLQSTEYNAAAYIKWLWQADNFNRVMHRRVLVMTRPAKMLLRFMRLGMLLQIVFGTYLIYRAVHIHHSGIGLGISVAFMLSTPIVWANLIVVPLVVGRWLIIKPLYARRVRQSAKVFAKHRGVKIAVAGSYGKTTVKEILATVLAEGKKVAATPANKNVSISHAIFAGKLEGDEEVLIIEYGEGAPGDVARFAKLTHPTMGVITGLAPAHLDKYKTLQAAGKDIFSLADYLGGKNVYVNAESKSTEAFNKSSYIDYSAEGVADWKVSGVKVSDNGLKFTMSKDSASLEVSSKLIGRHLIGPLALAVYLAARLGLSKEQILRGIAKIQPFEHRMQMYELHGAHVIDDTYNGNIDGMQAGLKLLTELPAKRKIYITPGLVDQGKESAQIHHQLGKYIAAAQPDIVILMKHSVTSSIVTGIKEGNFKGQLVIEDDPLNFYSNIDKFVAAGDLVLMQNDWPDNYR